MSRPPRRKRAWRVRLGARSRAAGRWCEWVAAAWLMARGWQILGFRLRTAAGEIDLLARRGGVLAVVEVKRRATIAAALEALGPWQRRRLLAAAQVLAARRPSLAGLDVRLDLFAFAPGCLPRHFPGLIVDEPMGS